MSKFWLFYKYIFSLATILPYASSSLVTSCSDATNRFLLYFLHPNTKHQAKTGTILDSVVFHEFFFSILQLHCNSNEQRWAAKFCMRQNRSNNFAFWKSFHVVVVVVTQKNLAEKLIIRQFVPLWRDQTKPFTLAPRACVPTLSPQSIRTNRF